MRKQITPGALTNRAVSYVYEPGSTFKLVTISAALEEKVTNPNELFDCQMGAIVYNGMRIRDSKPHGILPVWGVLAESSDVGAIKIALRLGEDRFYKYIRAYGFGQQTGIELPGETRGLTKPVSRWSKVSIAAISMGQEIGISPLQLAGLISTFANDGVWVAPRIVTGRGAAEGDAADGGVSSRAAHRVISPYTAAEMRSMMQKVVLEGTGRKAILEATRRRGRRARRRKWIRRPARIRRRNISDRLPGFAPVNNPQIVVAVILDSAVGLHQGGQVSAPVFQRISQQVLEYLHVPHDLPLAPQHQLLLAQAKMKDKDLEEGTPDHPGEPLETAEVNAEPMKPSMAASVARAPFGRLSDSARECGRQRQRCAGSNTRAGINDRGSVDRRSSRKRLSDSAPPAKLPTTGTVVLDVEQGGIEVPSFVGKTVRGAVEAAQDVGLELDAVGSGVARQQTPAGGNARGRRSAGHGAVRAVSQNLQPQRTRRYTKEIRKIFTVWCLCVLLW